MNRSLITAAAALFALLVACGPSQQTLPPELPGSFDQAHPLFDTLLAEHVDGEGSVNYTALAANRTALDSYLAEVTAVPESEFNQWSREDRLAFLINAYNAHTIALIIDNWPVESIRDTHALGNPWDNHEVPLLGSEFTLNEIEHELIRPVFEEPRIHFALVCAAVSCPPLLSRAHRGEDLEETLAAQTRAFLTNPERNDLSDPNSVRLSQLFDWYADDFGNVLQFVSDQSGIPLSANAAVDFLPYDWDLNGQ